jgi:hypothetical protein
VICFRPPARPASPQPTVVGEPLSRPSVQHLRVDLPLNLECQLRAAGLRISTTYRHRPAYRHLVPIVQDPFDVIRKELSPAFEVVAFLKSSLRRVAKVADAGLLEEQSRGGRPARPPMMAPLCAIGPSIWRAACLTLLGLAFGLGRSHHRVRFRLDRQDELENCSGFGVG